MKKFVEKQPDDSWRDKPVEAKMRILVDALNSLPQVETIASCQGHLCPASSPYVMFRAPTDFARALERRLREDFRAVKPLLKAEWTTVGMFDFNLEFYFYLYPAAYLECSMATKFGIINNDSRVISGFVRDIGKAEEQESGQKSLGNHAILDAILKNCPTRMIMGVHP